MGWSADFFYYYYLFVSFAGFAMVGLVMANNLFFCFCFFVFCLSWGYLQKVLKLYFRSMTECWQHCETNSCKIAICKKSTGSNNPNHFVS